MMLFYIFFVLLIGFISNTFKSCNRDFVQSYSYIKSVAADTKLAKRIWQVRNICREKTSYLLVTLGFVACLNGVVSNNVSRMITYNYIPYSFICL